MESVRHTTFRDALPARSRARTLSNAYGGHTLRTRSGMVALVVFLTAWMTVFADPRPSYAIAVLPPLPVLAPAAVASSVEIGVGAVSYFGATSGAVGTGATVAAAGAGSVAVAPVALAVGAVLLTGAAVYFGWRWANGKDAGTQLDPATSSGTGLGTWQGNETWPTTPDGNCLRASRADANPFLSFCVTKVGDVLYGTPTYRTDPPAGYRIISKQTPYSQWSYQESGVTKALAPAGVESRIEGESSVDLSLRVFGVFKPGAGDTGGSGAPSGSTTVSTTPTSRCSNGASLAGKAITYTGKTAQDDLPPIIAPACPAGTTRTGFSTPSTFPDGSAAPSPLGDWAPKIVPNGYPECQPAGACVLTLTQTHPDQRTTNCTNNVACYGWDTDATPETVTQSTGTKTQLQTLPDGTTRRVNPRTRPDGSQMKCEWGPYIIPANECIVIPTEPSLEPGPKTDTDGKNCVLGWSWNPIDWVLEPVKCALKWAFYPSPEAAVRWKIHAESIGSRPPVNLFIGGGIYIGQITDIFRNTNEQPCAFPFTSAYGHSFDVICYAGDTMQSDIRGKAIYRLGQIAMISAFVWWAWRRVGMSFGGRETTD